MMSDNLTLYYKYELVELSRIIQDISVTRAKEKDYRTTAIFQIPR